jgi:hypothetical protein
MIRLNDDKIVVEKIKSRIKENDGYCPCATIKDNTTKCMCEDFRNAVKNPKFKGVCHCGLYVKE